MLTRSQIKFRAEEWALSVGLSLSEAEQYARDYILVRGYDEAAKHWLTAEELD